MVRVAGRAIGLPNERFRREDEIMNIHAMVGDDGQVYGS